MNTETAFSFGRRSQVEKATMKIANRLLPDEMVLTVNEILVRQDKDARVSIWLICHNSVSRVAVWEYVERG